MIRAAVVVPTYRRHDFLTRLLAALAAQDMPADEFEIVVADDALSDATRELVERWAAHAPMAVRYVRPNGAHGPAAARNAGWRSTEAEIIAMTDDDCVAEIDWLSRGIADLEESGAAACAGRVVVPLPDGPTDYELDAAGLAKAEFVTANCFCRRSALEAVGGFDERFCYAWREDSDLYFTLLEHGCIVDRSLATVVHPVRPAGWGVSLGQQRKGLFDSLLFRKHPELYREKIAPFPLSYYAIAASLALAVGSLAVGAPRWATVGALTWGALTGGFFARRLEGTSRAPSHIAEMAVTSAVIPMASLYWHVRGMWRFGVWHR
jgi:glycosyltransferase involved in cell wall biosynthesis